MRSVFQCFCWAYSSGGMKFRTNDYLCKIIMQDRVESQYPLLRIPLQSVTSQFKKSRKDTQKQLNQVLSSIISLKNRDDVTQSTALSTLSSSKTKLYGLKRKLTSDYLKQNNIFESMRKRIHHISVSSIDEATYIKTKINRQIVEYMLLSGRYEESEKLARLMKVEEFCECQRELVKGLLEVVGEIRARGLGLAKRWCAENRTRLAKNQSNFEFKLILMEFISLIRENRKDQAVEFIRQQNLQITNPNKQQFQKAMGCLVFPVEDFPQYEYFFSEDRWKQLQELFKVACFTVYQLRFQSDLQKTLSVGISIIKTSCCAAREKNAICPICQVNFNKLAEHIPYTTKTHSTLICRVTKEQMNETNPPMMLPNGQILCKNAIDLLEKDGKVKCPFTDTYYGKAAVRKVFLF